jgi:hypothetical protein
MLIHALMSGLGKNPPVPVLGSAGTTNKIIQKNPSPVSCIVGCVFHIYFYNVNKFCNMKLR